MTIAQLKSLGNTPRLHGNAFIQLDLPDRKRLHVWHPDLLDIGQKVRTPIHDHLFSFKSMIIAGKLFHTVFEVTPDINGTHNIYEAIPRDKEDTELVKQGIIVNVKASESYILPIGASYVFSAFKFHETTALELTATIIQKISKYEGKPRVLCAIKEEPDNEFNRYNIPENILWKYIEETVKLWK